MSSAIIGVGAQSTLGGHQIFARTMCIKNQQNARILHDSCPKNYQNTRIFMIFARKFYKIPEFYMSFARKMPEFYVIIARKIFFSNFRGHVPPLPPPRLLRLCQQLIQVWESGDWGERLPWCSAACKVRATSAAGSTFGLVSSGSSSTSSDSCPDQRHIFLINSMIKPPSQLR